MRRILLLPVILFSAAVALGQTPQPDPLAPLEFLIGRWETTSEGKPGNGQGHREYVRALGTRFIQGRNVVVYPPREKNPKGEKHEDVGVFSWDRARKQFVLRQFHIEGFVNQYVADVPSKPGVIVFTTEAIENIPPGWRARETYTQISADEVEEVFELSQTGKEFEVYSRTRMKRVK